MCVWHTVPEEWNREFHLASSPFSSESDFTPRGHLSMSGDILVITAGGDLLLMSSRQRPGMLLNKHLTVHRTARLPPPPSKELSCPKCQQCQETDLEGRRQHMEIWTGNHWGYRDSFSFVHALFLHIKKIRCSLKVHKGTDNVIKWKINKPCSHHSKLALICLFKYF